MKPFAFFGHGLRFPRGVGLLLLAFLLILPAQAKELAKELNYLKPGQPDATTLLAPPPAAGSAEEAADLAEVWAVHRAAPASDIALAKEEKVITVFNFAPIIGDYFQADKLPKTAKFFKKILEDADATTEPGKAFFKRPHPYTVDPKLAGDKQETSFSYPSSHSVRATTMALVLAELLPDKAEAILAESRAIGWRRVERARHYATDTYAGRVLAQAIVRELHKSKDFQKDFKKVKAELAAAQK